MSNMEIALIKQLEEKLRQAMLTSDVLVLEDVWKVKTSEKLCKSSDHDPNHCYVYKSLRIFW